MNNRGKSVIHKNKEIQNIVGCMSSNVITLIRTPKDKEHRCHPELDLPWRNTTYEATTEEFECTEYYINNQYHDFIKSKMSPEELKIKKQKDQLYWKSLEEKHSPKKTSQEISIKITNEYYRICTERSLSESYTSSEEG